MKEGDETPWPICAACASIPVNMFSPTTSPSTAHLLQNSFHKLQDSALAGCHTCTLFYEATQEPFKSKLQSAPVYLESWSADTLEQPNVVVSANLARIIRREDGEETKLCEQFSGLNLEPFKFTPIAEVKFVSSKDDVPGAARHHNHLVSRYTDDLGAINYIRQSLDLCLKNHRNSCDMVIFPHSASTTQQSGPIKIVFGKNGQTTAPTRLIDVGSTDGEIARLVPGQQCLKGGIGYIVLSYCNGKTPSDAPWRLTSKSMTQFEEAMPLELFPQTLYDAISMTRQLGERFIWIDNLCIIQDSKEDWERESLRMASIYGSATMTLVAASGSIYGGMTDRINPLRNSAAALSCSAPNMKDKDRRTIWILPNGQKRSTPFPAPTEDRAWCYQEDLMSPRLVKFSRTALEWQCVGNHTSIERARSLKRIGNLEVWKWYFIWYRFVERYSRKNITYFTDKLPAFSGIAASKLKGEYLAGILRDDLWAGLIWCRDEIVYNTNAIARYNVYVAPSWSWASLQGAIKFPYIEKRGKMKYEPATTILDPVLLDAKLSRSTYNPFGSVNGGFLDILAYCTDAKTTSEQPALFEQAEEARKPGRMRLVSGPDRLIIGDVIFDTVAEATENLDIHCILLQVEEINTWVKNGVAGIGIGLQLCGTQNNSITYSRIGYLRLTSNFLKVSHWQRLRIT